MKHIEERVQAFINFLKEKMRVKVVEIDSIFYKECEYKQNNCLPNRKDMISFQGVWGGKRDAHAWFSFDIEIEDLEGCYAEVEAKTNKEGWDLSNPQFLVYLDGEIQQGLDTNHCAFFVPTGTHTVYLYAYTGTNVDEILPFTARVIYTNKSVEKLYYDLEVGYKGILLCEKNTKDYVDALLALNEACKKLDLLEPNVDKFYMACEKVSQWIRKHFYKYEKNQPLLACVGQTHIDVAWLWTIRQTREKVQRSFATVLALMEKYPNYIFLASQPYLYEMIKEEAPALYERVKERVQEGRWETEGAMFVEADCNMSSGESLIRQIALGKKFFKEEFGVDSKVLWLPDSFGFPATLPQIMRKTGVDTLVTNKLSWNDVNQMPYDIFEWYGIDNSKVFAYFLTGKDKTNYERYTSCNCDATPAFFAGTYDRLQQKELTNEAIFTYGYGDGGGGPSKEFLENLERGKYGIPGLPQTHNDTLRNSLQRIEKKSRKTGRLPKWRGELYFEFHRGVYSSLALNKKNNRVAEGMLHNIEAYSAMAEQLLGFEYPSVWLAKAWKTVLINQFHDILPGTSVAEAHVQSDSEYAELFVEGNEILKERINALAKNSSNNIVFNTNGFAVSGYVSLQGEYRFVENIPAYGFKTVSFTPEKKNVRVQSRVMENEFYRVKFNAVYEIVSIYDKAEQREVLKGVAGLRLYEDRPLQFDSAELRACYKEKAYVPKFQSVEDVCYGEKKGKRIVYQIGKSTITQEVCLYARSRRIDFDTKVDWQEERVVLRALFPIDINASCSTSDIQFGKVQRPTTENTSWEKAKFEYCAHKYIDISEGDYGVALMNDCKYGHSATGNVLGITLLRCHQLSANYKDKGFHSFTYSLYPHKGALNASDVEEQAYILNNPLICVESSEKTIERSEFSFVQCDNSNVMIETVKKAEDGRGYIIRLYETNNSRVNCTLTFAKQLHKAYACDMLENLEDELFVKDKKINVGLKPFEVSTIRVII